MKWHMPLLVYVLLSPSAAFSCEQGERVRFPFEEYDFVVEVPPNLPARALVSLCGELTCRSGNCRPVSNVEVSARMPQHSHGMNTRPEIKLQKNNVLVKGLYFHMKGRWELAVDLQTGNSTERAINQVVVP